jgi:PAS domain S-box-containing protein
MTGADGRSGKNQMKQQRDIDIRDGAEPGSAVVTPEALLLAEKRLRDVIEGAQVGTWTWDFDTVGQIVNDVWAEMLGYELEEMSTITYDTWSTIIHPDDKEWVEEALRRCTTGLDQSYETEYRMRHRKGHWIWVLDRARVVRRKADGSPKVMAGIQIEISELKSREAALMRAKAELEKALAQRASAEQRFSDIVAVTDGWLWEQDQDLRFSYLSGTNHVEQLGLTGSSVLGKTREEWLAAFPEVRNSADWDIVLTAQRDRLPFRNFVYLAPNAPDGVERWFRISGQPVFDHAGVFLGYRGVGTDVTELYLSKARAEEASRTKSMFLANMSHEIRTPLNGVLGMAEVLEGALTDPEHKRMIGTIRKSGETLLNILNDILDMSKIEAGKLEMEDVPFSPVDLAERVEDLHRLRAEEKDLDFEVLVSTGAETRRKGDPFRVQQILHNLVSNAIKFTDRGEVAVEVSGRAGKPLTIEVRDTGIGMSQQEIERLHEEFRQADSSVTRRFGGTGLGMAITRTLVQRMGGEIAVQSAPGAGTTVRVTLPLPVTDAAPDVAGPAPAAADQGRLDGLRILAADDNGTNRSVLELMLTRSGAQVTTVVDGLQAVNAWEPGKYDAVLLDIAMPVMDGKGALEAIRAMEAASGSGRVPIIAVTANAMSHQIVEYLIWGFDSCVSKPLTMSDVTKAIRAMVPKA